VRIAWLIQGITASVDGWFRALAELDNELLIVHQADLPNTAFESSQYGEYGRALPWQKPPPANEVIEVVKSFSPDAVVMSSWGWPPSYRAAMRALEPRVLRILAMDNTWDATPRQWLGRLTHRLYISPLFDCVLVPSDRTEWFARRLGFDSKDVIRGLYSGDTSLFNRGSRTGQQLIASRSFLFAGRLVPVKGVDVLAESFRRYRQLSADPWGLSVVGIGELEGLLSNSPGVTMHGFLQPAQLAELMQSCSCLVLPSRFEPYGLVVHEAAAAGLALLISDVAGAGPGLVQDGYNGWVLPPGDPNMWARAMHRVSTATAERLEQMSGVSQALSTRLSIPGWARNLHEQIEQRIPVNRRRSSPLRGLLVRR
jgi:glycosyltransferase involved in cell wall biosynthesis